MSTIRVGDSDPPEPKPTYAFVPGNFPEPPPTNPSHPSSVTMGTVDPFPSYSNYPKDNGSSSKPAQPPEYTESTQDSKLNAVPAFRTRFASVSLHMLDRIRLLSFPAEDVVQIQNVVQQCWPRGIQEVRQYDVSHEIKLYGNPWSERQGAVDSRRLMCAVMAGLFEMGWVLKASVDISRKNMDKDTLIFRQQDPAPPPCTWLSISFARGDKLLLIDAPPELNAALVKVMAKRIQRAENTLQNTLTIKFHGYPWVAQGTETVQSRVIVLTMLEVLEEHGFSLYAAIDQDNGPGNSSASGADVWFCCRALDWVPGAPIYHN